MDLSEEQLKALKTTNRTSVIYEKSEANIDIFTGEIINKTSQTLKKTSAEPDFIKLYYKTMLAFNGVDSSIPLDFVIALSEHITWANDDQMIFKNDKITRVTLSKKLNLKDSMVQKYITRCSESGLLIPMKGFRGTYYVNPFFIAKGRWENIKELRTSFDYVNGKWEVKLQEGNENNEID